MFQNCSQNRGTALHVTLYLLSGSAFLRYICTKPSALCSVAPWHQKCSCQRHTFISQDFFSFSPGFLSTLLANQGHYDLNTPRKGNQKKGKHVQSPVTSYHISSLKPGATLVSHQSGLAGLPQAVTSRELCLCYVLLLLRVNTGF